MSPVVTLLTGKSDVFSSISSEEELASCMDNKHTRRIGGLGAFPDIETLVGTSSLLVAFGSMALNAESLKLSLLTWPNYKLHRRAREAPELMNLTTGLISVVESNVMIDHGEHSHRSQVGEHDYNHGCSLLGRAYYLIQGAHNNNRYGYVARGFPLISATLR